jgi:hypothetical protein
LDRLISGHHPRRSEADGDVRFEAVEAWIRTLLPDLGREVHRWSGQVVDTIDHSAFIGKNLGNDNVFIITGDSKNRRLRLSRPQKPAALRQNRSQQITTPQPISPRRLA